MQKSTPKIVGAGICCLDYIATAPRPQWGGTTRINNYLRAGGGLVATALVACARLGAQTELISMLGGDKVGGEILEGLRREDLGVAHVKRSKEGLSPFSFIHVDERHGDRTIFHHPGRGLTHHVDLAVLDGADVLLVDDYYPELVREVVPKAREKGIPIIADTSPTEKDRDWLAQVDILIAPNDYFNTGDFGYDLDRALDTIHDYGPSTAVITQGAEGWAASHQGNRYRGPAFNVDAVDTTGAGDVFHGAYAFAVAQGWDIPKCAEFSSAVSALKCTQPGGRAGIPNLIQALDFLKEKSVNNWKILWKIIKS
jgi:sulfofructose kinase